MLIIGAEEPEHARDDIYANERLQMLVAKPLKYR